MNTEFCTVCECLGPYATTTTTSTTTTTTTTTTTDDCKPTQPSTPVCHNKLQHLVYVQKVLEPALMKMMVLQQQQQQLHQIKLHYEHQH